MSTFTGLLALFMIASIPLFAATSVPLTSADRVYVDLGIVAVGEKLHGEFKIINDSFDIVEIIRRTSSCGCSAVSSGEAVVKPGMTTTIVVDFERRTRSGEISSEIVVEWRSKSVSAGVLRIMVVGQYRSPLSVSSDVIMINSSVPQSIDIVSSDARVATSSVDVGPRHQGISANIVEIAKGHWRVLFAADNSQFPVGSSRFNVRILAHDALGTVIGEVPCAVVVTRSSDVSASPRQILTRMTKGANAAKINVQILPSLGRTVKVVKVYSSEEWLSGKVVEINGETSVVLVSISSDGKSSNATLFVDYEIQSVRETLSIPVARFVSNVTAKTESR